LTAELDAGTADTPDAVWFKLEELVPYWTRLSLKGPEGLSVRHTIVTEVGLTDCK
jgi:hypothetical protein